MAKKINDDVLDELLKGCEGPEDLLGEGGVMQGLKKALMQRMLGAELTEHLGYEHGEEAPPVQTNRRNGVSRKTVKSEGGVFEIEVPRDREGSFEPRLIGKGQTRIDGLDDKIIAMYARGMSVRDIRGHLEELYGLEVSPDLISRVTDAVLDEVKEWRSRALDAVYPVVIFDALRVKIRDKDSRIVKNKAVYLALGITGDGQREVLGLWIAENEGAKFWLSVMNELRNRGVQDILIAVVDGLKGFPEAITAAFPQTTVEGPQGGRGQAPRGLQRRDRGGGPGRAGDLRRRLGPAISLDRPGVAQGLGRGDPVLRLQPRDQAGDLHHECRGKPEPGDPQGNQDAGLVPVGGCRREAHLSGHPRPREIVSNGQRVADSGEPVRHHVRGSLQANPGLKAARVEPGRRPNTQSS
jgi:putative transposase